MIIVISTPPQDQPQPAGTKIPINIQMEGGNPGLAKDMLSGAMQFVLQQENEAKKRSTLIVPAPKIPKDIRGLLGNNGQAPGR